MTSPTKTVVLITGANQGLGFECVKKLAAEQPNYHIILCSRDIQKGEKAASKITHFAENASVEALQLDVTSDESIDAAAKAVEHKHGRLDVLFNNAGIGRGGEKTLRAEIAKVVDTNAISAAIVTEAFSPLLKKSDNPRLVFMTSGLGSISSTLDPTFRYYGAGSHNPSYLVSKAAMNMIAVTYAVKYKDDGFKVNVCCPGHRATNLNNYSKEADKFEDGAIQPCKLMTMGKDGPTGTFTSLEGTYPW